MLSILDFQIPESSMHLVAWLSAQLDDRAAAQLALEQGIEIAEIRRHLPGSWLKQYDSSGVRASRKVGSEHQRRFVATFWEAG